MIILIILIIVLLLSFFFINKTFKKKDNILDEVKLQENTIKNNGFALMLQQNDGTYKESTNSKWPTDMKFNAELSGCMDANGNKIENSLSFNSTTNSVTVKANKTSYCYMYFDIKSTLNDYLIDNAGDDLWKSTLYKDGYRFVGTNPKNYICFGTTDKDTCINDQDKYMYRIIGIFEDNDGNQHLKLIKKEALNTKYAWHSDKTTDTSWVESDAFEGLNGSYFLKNSNYSYMQDSTWTNKITKWDYTTTNTKSYENYTNNSVYGLYYGENTGKVIYLHELNKGVASETCYYNYGSSPADADCKSGKREIVSSKIGLMYASDYALSLGSKAIDYVGANNKSTMKTGWMQIDNNDTGAPDNWEWTITRDGNYNGYNAWIISSDGGIDRYYVSNALSLRPVFYLESNIEYDGGDGTINNPIIISGEEEKGAAATLINTIPEDTLWPSTLEDDGYRYVGTNPNNYICFGTSDKSTCTGNTDKYMYRIIGVFKDSSGSKHLKLIKKEALNTAYAWNSSKTTDVNWGYNDLYSGIIGNYFLTNSNYSYMQDTNWSNKISNWNYTATNTYAYENYLKGRDYGLIYGNNTVRVVYLHELNRSSKNTETCYYLSSTVADCTAGIWDTLNAKISLMYVSDYLLSLGKISLNYVVTNNYSTLETGWMHLSSSDSSAPNSWEWTMSRFGNNSGYRAFLINASGNVDYYVINNTYSARPVFYLESNVEFSDGTGTSSDPYIIK